MKDTIIIDVEPVNTCFGVMVRFWEGDRLLRDSGRNQVVNSMYEITASYKNRQGKEVMFRTRRHEE